MFAKMMIVSSALILSASFAHANDPVKAADKSAVDSACSADAATAGCGGEKVGSGLMKCMFTYKRAHKDFKFSQGCKDAMKQLRTDKKAGK